MLRRSNQSQVWVISATEAEKQSKSTQQKEVDLVEDKDDKKKKAGRA